MKEVPATLTNIALVTDRAGELCITIEIEGRGPFTFADLTIAQITALIMVISGGAVSLRGLSFPRPCVARFLNGRLTALRHPTELRWVVFEVEPVVRLVRTAEDMVQ